MSAEDFADLKSPNYIRLSPDGKHVAYILQAWTKADDTAKTSIWLAEFGEIHSARQITCGRFNDGLLAWSPDSKILAFTSDRAGEGKKCAIYLLDINRRTKPCPVTDQNHEGMIKNIVWSPDGRFIAYSSPDEFTENERKRMGKKDDVIIYSDHWRPDRLRLLEVALRTCSVVFSDSSHVGSFAWSPDSKRVAIVTSLTSQIESSQVNGSVIKFVAIDDRYIKHKVEFPHKIFYGPVWTRKGVYFIAGFRPENWFTSRVLYSASLSENSFERLGSGETDYVMIFRNCGGSATFLNQVGYTDEIITTDGSAIHRLDQGIMDFDYTHLDQDKLVYITSTVSAPPQVYSKETTDGIPKQLSSHGLDALLQSMAIDTKIVRCRSYDNCVDLDALWLAPKGAGESIRLPTIVCIHGGPGIRATNAWDAGPYQWCPWFMSKQKYGMLVVNYRGSTARGDDFVKFAQGGVGTYDYNDVVQLTDVAIKEGLVDKNRVLVMGWSQGGFLSYLNAVRNGRTTLPNNTQKTWAYSGAICGGGVVDWDMLVMTSQAPDFQSALTGGNPWSRDKDWIGGRQGSAIWELAAAHRHVPPILILHGEQDAQILVSQAKAFHAGCLKYDIPCEMAIYPREQHFVVERAHTIDLLNRVARFVETHIS